MASFSGRNGPVRPNHCGSGLASQIASAELGGGSDPTMSPTSIFAPVSSSADAIHGLAIFVSLVAGAIFIVVASLIAFAIVKFRSRAQDGAEWEPPQVYGSVQIELAWTVIPVLIVLVLFLATARVIATIQDANPLPEELEVVVVGHQFWWEYRYPSLGIVTANELHVPVSEAGRPSRIFMTMLSADTDHSFWVPRLAGKIDLIPNHVNRWWFEPREVGLFLGQCAQYCGTQHAKMLQRVYVDSARDFARWIELQRQPAAAESANEAVAAGRRLFEQNACANCHRVGGTPADGRFGPDLTHLMSRDTLASGAAPNTPEQLRRWLENPEAIKPGSKMPAMRLADPDLDALTAYMTSLR